MGIQVRLGSVYDPLPGVQRVAVVFAIREMRRLGRRIQVNARRRVKVRTGRTRNSIGFSVQVSGGQARLETFATTPYSRYLHDGTHPHVIRPRNARALRFQVGGRTVFARSVRHPGTHATNFLSAAVAEELARENLA